MCFRRLGLVGTNSHPGNDSSEQLLGAAPRSDALQPPRAPSPCAPSSPAPFSRAPSRCAFSTASVWPASVSPASVTWSGWTHERVGERTHGCRPGGNDRASALRKAIVSVVSSLVAACLAGRASQTRACREDLRSNSKITRSNRGSRGHSKRKGTEVRSPFRTRVRTRAGEARADRGVPHRMPSADPLDNGKPRGMEALGSGSL